MQQDRLKVTVPPLVDRAFRGGTWEHGVPNALRATSGLTGVQYSHMALGIRLAREPLEEQCQKTD